jgi:hypothetical protein
MSYTNAEILSGILVAACLLLLYCWSRKSNTSGLSNFPGLKFKRSKTSGLEYGRKSHSENVPGVHFAKRSNSNSAGYTKRSGMEDVDDGPVAGLNDMVDSTSDANFTSIQRPESLPDTTKMLRYPDADIQINNFNATAEDLECDNTQYGHEQSDPALNREKTNVKRRGSLGVDLMTLTDITPEYGNARGSVTMG